ncbi:MAG: radical SAM protein [Candidatus Omnitrophica bacterium]|nr:radical SAM protein [Candidatus Omnitrophota bacterium]
MASFFRRSGQDNPRLPSMPEEIEIETTTTCNINPPCVMCCRHLATMAPVAFIPQEMIEKLKPLFPRIKSVSLHGIGEPLMQEALFSLMDRFSPQAHISFTSNGILLDKKKILQMIKHRLNRLSVSLDAANPLTYKKIRRDDYFCAIKNNLKLLFEIKKELGVDYPELWINMTIMNENLAEVVDFVRLAQEVEANAVEFHVLGQMPVQYCVKSDSFNFDYAAQMIDTSSSLFIENMRAAKVMADQLSIRFSSMIDEILKAIQPNPGRGCERQKQRKKYYCTRPWRHALIHLNGDVWVCCHMRGENCVMGNLNGSDFNTIWNNDKITSIRKDIAKGIMPSACSHCPVFEK